jgi:hypothetical protein
LDLILVGSEGEYLGEASSNEYASDGVCNRYSSYGSEYSSTSIYNPYGEYGSSYSSISAYSEYTTTPPQLYCASTDEWLNPVSKNTLLSGAIDPDVLCEVLAENGY